MVRLQVSIKPGVTWCGPEPFESTISNLQNIAENASAARSRIIDTDYAAESANLTKNQIMQQAGTAMLAQAPVAAGSPQPAGLRVG